MKDICMKDITNLLNIIEIVSDGNTYSVKQLSKILNMTQFSLKRHIYTLGKWGIDFNTNTANVVQLSRKIELLNYEQIYSIIKYGNLIIKPVINSTNQYLLNHIDQLSSGDSCIAEYQTAGRGRRGRYWASPFGSNIYLSLYWNLHKGQAAAIGLSLVTGIIIAETINKLIGSNIKVKWPNDLYLNKKKLAGILIEITGNINNTAHIVIGIGLNIAMNSNYKTDINTEWINLEEAGFRIERNVIAGHIILALRYGLMKFEKYGLVHFIKRWFALDEFLHKKVKLYVGNQVEIGIVKGINNYGAILLEQYGKIVSYYGEISLRAYY